MLGTTTSSSARPSVTIEGDAARDAYIANRGLGNAGLFLEAGKPYEFEARVWQDASTTGFAAGLVREVLWEELRFRGYLSVQNARKLKLPF